MRKTRRKDGAMARRDARAALRKKWTVQVSDVEVGRRSWSDGGLAGSGFFVKLCLRGVSPLPISSGWEGGSKWEHLDLQFSICSNDVMLSLVWFHGFSIWLPCGSDSVGRIDWKTLPRSFPGPSYPPPPPLPSSLLHPQLTLVL